MLVHFFVVGAKVYKWTLATSHLGTIRPCRRRPQTQLLTFNCIINVSVVCSFSFIFNLFSSQPRLATGLQPRLTIGF